MLLIHTAAANKKLLITHVTVILGIVGLLTVTSGHLIRGTGEHLS